MLLLWTQLADEVYLDSLQGQQDHPLYGRSRKRAIVTYRAVAGDGSGVANAQEGHAQSDPLEKEFVEKAGELLTSGQPFFAREAAQAAMISPSFATFFLGRLAARGVLSTMENLASASRS